MSDWNSGPDELYPASSFISTKLTEPVKLRFKYQNEDLYDLKPVSVYTVFKQRVQKTPNHIALVGKRSNEKFSISYEQYWNQCHQAAKSFIKLGLEHGQSVGIIGFNSPEWMMSLFGAIFAGGVASGIYTTNNADACEFIIKDSSSRIVVVENNDQLKKILKIKDNCNIVKIIQYTGEVVDSYNGLIISWKEFMDVGSSVSDEEIQQRLKKIAPNKCATLIYTSGTTGPPKAAMLSHDNINYATKYVIDTVGLREAQERFVSYLPLSHIAAQLIDCFIAVTAGVTIYYAQPDAMKGTLAVTLAEVKPTIFLGVPRVWEKIEDKMIQMAKASTQKISPDQVKHLLGFGEARGLYSGAAPIKAKTLKFFANFGIQILEVFGMSESSGPHTVGVPYHNLIGSVGYNLNQFFRTQILNPDSDGNGEICLYGRHVCMGYLNSEKKTLETIDSDGWLHSGDIGRIQYDFLYITGRIKELLITAGGENISPVPLEESLVAELPDLISNCMVIGDHRNYLTVLIALKAKLDPNTTASLDELSDEAIAWLKNNGSTKTKVSQVLAEGDSAINNAIQKALENVNKKAISNAAQIRKFKILPRDFSLATGELGPTLKLRRPIVVKMYESLIDELYQ